MVTNYIRISGGGTLVLLFFKSPQVKLETSELDPIKLEANTVALTSVLLRDYFSPPLNPYIEGRELLAPW